MFHSLIICTRNRPDEISSIISNLNLIEPHFNKILVIDSSDTPLRLKDLPQNDRLYVHNCEKGLSKARNLGISLVDEESDVIHFVDDDVSLTLDYLLNVNIFFNNFPEASAVTGLDLNLDSNSSYKLVLLRMFVKIFNLEGKISRFGFNFGNYSRGGTYKVDWMPGCNMIVKREVLRQFNFVEDNNPLFFEDFIFGLNFSEDFDIYFSDTIEYRHHLSPNNRLGVIQKKNSIIYNQSYLIHNYKEKFNSTFIKIRIMQLKIYLVFYDFLNRHPF